MSSFLRSAAPARRARRAAVLALGWAALVATGDGDRIVLAEQEVRGVLPIRAGVGSIELVIVLEGLYVEPRGNVLLEVETPPRQSAADAGAATVLYRLEWPDGRVEEWEGGLAHVPYHAWSERPAELCGGVSPCELRVPIAAAADPSVNGDPGLTVDVRAVTGTEATPGRLTAYLADAP